MKAIGPSILVVFFAVLGVAFAASKDYYRILGVKKNADDKQLKAAFRKLARKYHPDKVKPEEKEKAEKKFVEIAEAYQVLSDPEKKRIYDQVGAEGLKQEEARQQAGAAGGFPGGGGFQFQDAHKLFEQMFGSFSEGGRRGGGANPFGNIHFDMGGSGGFGGFGGFGGMGGGMPGFEQMNMGGGGSGPGMDGRFGGGMPGKGFGGDGGGRSRPTELYGVGSKVSELSGARFPDKKAKNVWIIKFYSPGCPHCQNAVVTLEKLAAKMEGSVKVGAVNCDAHQDICSKYRIQSYPTFKLLVDGRATDYTGHADGKALFDFVQENLPSRITNIRRTAQATDMLKQAQESKQNAVLLFTDKFETSLMYKGLAYQLRADVTFGEVRASNIAVGDRFGVGKYPTLLVFCQGGEEAIVEFPGDMKAKDVREWLIGLQQANQCRQAAHRIPRSPARQKPNLKQLDFRRMRVGQLRELLEQVGEQCIGCAEKDDFVKRLEELASEVR